MTILGNYVIDMGVRSAFFPIYWRVRQGCYPFYELKPKLHKEMGGKESLP